VDLDRIVQSNVGRVVAFVFTPILLPVVGGLAFWLQKVIGIHMDPAEATGYIVAIVAGAGLTAYKWVHNRGEFEKAALEVHKLYEAGRELVAQDQAAADPEVDVPTVPPGLAQ
jgi:hypothetical protein